MVPPTTTLPPLPLHPPPPTLPYQPTTKIGEVLKTARSVVDPLNYSNSHHLTNQMPLVPTYRSHTALIKVGGVNRWLRPPKLGRSNVQTYLSYLNSSLVPRLHLLLVLVWDYSFPTLHPPPFPSLPPSSSLFLSPFLLDKGQDIWWDSWREQTSATSEKLPTSWERRERRGVCRKGRLAAKRKITG